VEAFLTRTERAQEVAQLRLKEILLCYGILLTTGSAFVVEAVQALSQGLNMSWKLHTAYHPQSSGKAECMNQTLKLSKLYQETHLKWTQVLPTALLKIRYSINKQA
jgi:hypothetical protein